MSVRDLVVHRGKQEVLHGLSCSLPVGSVTGLLGPSGCGKSTLLRTLVGVQRISSGTVSLLGLPAGHRRLRRLVAYTSQSLSGYADATVEANVRYFARLVGAGPRNAAEAIEQVQLGEYAHRRVNQLSGGQASRASLACALVGRPRLLVLDEPTVGLDPLTRQSLWQLFAQLAATGVTLIISSHVMDEATRCDAVLLLREGRFLAYEPVSEIQSRTGTQTPEAAFMALIKEAA